MIRRPPRSTLFPTRRSSDLQIQPSLSCLRFYTWYQKKANLHFHHLRSEEHTSELQSQSNLLFPLFFFFNDTATTEIYPLSYTTLFRSPDSAVPVLPALLYLVPEKSQPTFPSPTVFWYIPSFTVFIVSSLRNPSFTTCETSVFKRVGLTNFPPLAKTALTKAI